MAKEINHKPLIIDKLLEYFNEAPEYTMGDILYSLVKEVSQKNSIEKIKLRKITDEMFYRALSKSLSQEVEDEYFNKEEQ